MVIMRALIILLFPLCLLAQNARDPFTPATLPSTCVGQPFHQGIGVRSIGTYDFEVIKGDLPAGFALDIHGNLDGTAEKPGNYSFTVRGTSGSISIDHPYTLRILAEGSTEEKDNGSEFPSKPNGSYGPMGPTKGKPAPKKP